ncbi:MAG: hypothetical protein AB7C91_04585 [Sphaerochaeta sp.]
MGERKQRPILYFLGTACGLFRKEGVESKGCISATLVYPATNRQSPF